MPTARIRIGAACAAASVLYRVKIGASAARHASRSNHAWRRIPAPSPSLVAFALALARPALGRRVAPCARAIRAGAPSAAASLRSSERRCRRRCEEFALPSKCSAALRGMHACLCLPARKVDTAPKMSLVFAPPTRSRGRLHPPRPPYLRCARPRERILWGQNWRADSGQSRRSSCAARPGAMSAPSLPGDSWRLQVDRSATPKLSLRFEAFVRSRDRLRPHMSPYLRCVRPRERISQGQIWRFSNAVARSVRQMAPQRRLGGERLLGLRTGWSTLRVQEACLSWPKTYLESAN
jgi:hypothetical protein